MKYTELRSADCGCSIMVIMCDCQSQDEGSIPFTHIQGGGSYMAKGDIVTAKVKVRKQMYGKVIEAGAEVAVYITQDGRAQVMKLPSIVFLPSEYDLLIPDDVYDKLLQHGDMV